MQFIGHQVHLRMVTKATVSPGEDQEVNGEKPGKSKIFRKRVSPFKIISLTYVPLSFF